MHRNEAFPYERGGVICDAGEMGTPKSSGRIWFVRLQGKPDYYHVFFLLGECCRMRSTIELSQLLTQLFTQFFTWRLHSTFKMFILAWNHLNIYFLYFKLFNSVYLIKPFHISLCLKLWGFIEAYFKHHFAVQHSFSAGNAFSSLLFLFFHLFLVIISYSFLGINWYKLTLGIKFPLFQMGLNYPNAK